MNTIVLDGIHHDFSKLIPSYLFNQCLQLANVTLKNCSLAGEIYITSSKLRHLNMIDCGSEISAPYMIYIDAKNLSSFEYSGVITRKISVMAPKLLEIFLNASVKHKYSGHTTTAPKLLKVFWNAAAVREENRQIKRLCQFWILKIVFCLSNLCLGKISLNCSFYDSFFSPLNCFRRYWRF